MDVYDSEGHKVGAISHVYRHSLIAAGEVAGSWHADDRIEVSTGLFGLGTHLYVPFDAVDEVTHAAVTLTQTKREIDDLGWERKPSTLPEEH